jgi:hypothetical protein
VSAEGTPRFSVMRIRLRARRAPPATEREVRVRGSARAIERSAAFRNIALHARKFKSPTGCLTVDFLTIAVIPLDRQPRTQYVDLLAAFRRTREKRPGPASSQQSIGLQLQCW